MRKLKLKHIALTLLVVLSGTLLIGAVRNAQAADADTTPFTIPQLGLPNTEIQPVLQSVTNWFLFIAGILCVVIIVMAGVAYATAGGDETKTTAAKNKLIYGILGIVVILAAYIIASTIAKVLAGDSTVPTLN